MRQIRFTVLLTAVLFLLTPVLAADREEITKSGWSFGLLPAFYYNSDLGFSGGVLAQVFDYGDGTVYPNYRTNSRLM